jgi:tetratricopeptide (TPR) repeat protein
MRAGGVAAGPVKLAELTQQWMDAILGKDFARAIDLARQAVALAAGLGEHELQEETLDLLGQAYDLAGKSTDALETYRAVLALEDGLPGHGNTLLRGKAYDWIGYEWVQLGKPEKAIEAFRAAIAADVGDIPAAVDQRQSSTVGLAEALEATGKPREARALAEPVLRALADRDDKMYRRGLAAFIVARALWDGDARDRGRARALADDAVRDLRATLAKEGDAAYRPAHQAKLDAMLAWQKRRAN